MSAAADERPLTGARALAALLVFFSHFQLFQPLYGRVSEPWHAIFIEGHAGVTLFFVLSGFLLTRRYFPAPGTGRFSLREYAVKRAARILPLYYAMVALTFIASPLTGISIYAPLPLVNLTLTQAYFSDLVYSLLIPAWSMTVEAAFYLLLPLMLLSLRAVERLWAQAGVLALWAGGLLAGGVGAVALSKAAGWNTFYGFMGNADVMLVHTIFGRGIDLCIGVLLGLFVRRHGEALWRVHFARQNALLLALSSAGGVVALQVAMNAAGGGLGPAWYFNPLTALCWALLLLALTCPASPPARLFGAAPLVALGHISYALYLLQGTPVSIALFQLWGSPPVHYVVISLLSAGCTLAIERPARAWLVRKLSIARRGAPPV